MAAALGCCLQTMTSASGLKAVGLWWMPFVRAWLRGGGWSCGFELLLRVNDKCVGKESRLGLWWICRLFGLLVTTGHEDWCSDRWICDCDMRLRGGGWSCSCGFGLLLVDDEEALGLRAGLDCGRYAGCSGFLL